MLKPGARQANIKEWAQFLLSLFHLCANPRRRLATTLIMSLILRMLRYKWVLFSFCQRSELLHLSAEALRKAWHDVYQWEERRNHQTKHKAHCGVSCWHSYCTTWRLRKALIKVFPNVLADGTISYHCNVNVWDSFGCLWIKALYSKFQQKTPALLVNYTFMGNFHSHKLLLQLNVKSHSGNMHIYSESRIIIVPLKTFSINIGNICHKE